MRELLARDGGWTQNATARDASGKEVDEISVEAVSFDLLGAMTRAGVNARPGAIDQAMRRLHAAIGFNSLGDWNDERGRSQAEVVALLDAAIAAATTRAPSGCRNKKLLLARTGEVS